VDSSTIEYSRTRSISRFIQHCFVHRKAQDDTSSYDAQIRVRRRIGEKTSLEPGKNDLQEQDYNRQKRINLALIERENRASHEVRNY